MFLSPVKQLISALRCVKFIQFFDGLVERQILVDERLRARISRTAEVDVASGGGGEAIGAAARQLVLQEYDWEKNLQGLGAMLGLPAAAVAGSGAPAATPLPAREPST